jgi:hypothetical protein
MRKPAQAKYIAPAIHALLFVAMWVLYWACGQPLMDGPSALPFFILFLADLPISAFAFGVMFTSSANGALAAVCWGVLGTFWWFLLGLAIDARVRGSRKKHSKTIEEGTTGNGSEQLLPTEPSGDMSVSSQRKTWLVAGTVVIALVLTALVWKWNGPQGNVQDGEIGSITFAPDGRSVLFYRAQGKSSVLYSVALNTGESVPLGKTAWGIERSPTYSPDGKQIAFVNEAEAKHSRIFIMNADGSNSHPLFSARVEADDFSPRFSLDGKELYFARARSISDDSAPARPDSRQWDVYSVSLDGRDVRPLTNQHFYGYSEPSFSGDGKKMVFSVALEDDGQFHLFSFGEIVNHDTVLQPHPPNEPRSPVYDRASLSADGRSVYYLAASQGAKAYDYDVYRLDLVNDAVERLTSANGYASDLCVSTDGRHAVFLKWTARWGSTPNMSHMYLLDLSTKRLTALNITGTG